MFGGSVGARRNSGLVEFEIQIEDRTQFTDADETTVDRSTVLQYSYPVKHLWEYSSTIVLVVQVHNTPVQL